jgi:hypothetical protein
MQNQQRSSFSSVQGRTAALWFKSLVVQATSGSIEVWRRERRSSGHVRWLTGSEDERGGRKTNGDGRPPGQLSLQAMVVLRMSSGRGSRRAMLGSTSRSSWCCSFVRESTEAAEQRWRPVTRCSGERCVATQASETRAMAATRRAQGAQGLCDNPPRKIPYYRLNQSTLVIKQ